MTLGQKICALRERASLSQDELAEKLDVSRQTISNWENDKAKMDVDKAKQLCRFFDISMDELFLERSDVQPTKKFPMKKMLIIVFLLLIIVATSAFSKSFVCVCCMIACCILVFATLFFVVIDCKKKK